MNRNNKSLEHDLNSYNSKFSEQTIRTRREKKDCSKSVIFTLCELIDIFPVT